MGRASLDRFCAFRACRRGFSSADFGLAAEVVKKLRLEKGSYMRQGQTLNMVPWKAFVAIIMAAVLVVVPFTGVLIGRLLALPRLVGTGPSEETLWNFRQGICAWLKTGLLRSCWPFAIGVRIQKNRTR